MHAQLLHECKPVSEEPLTWTDVQRPNAAAEEVLIKVHACGICRTDLHVVEGELDPSRYTLPLIPGHQIVGSIESVPKNSLLRPGQRVGVPWLNKTCGSCRFCRSGRENLCEHPEFTGWTRNGGFAEYVTAAADFVYELPPALSPVPVSFLHVRHHHQYRLY